MPSGPAIRRRLGLSVALAALALSLAGCLTMATRPTASPGPTPVPPTGSAPAPTPTPGPPTPSPAPTFASYTVRAGDNLTAIARRFGTTPRSIAYWNRGTYPSLDPESPKYAPNSLQIGWVLRVLPGGLYTPPPETDNPSLDVTPVPTEYLGPPTEPPSGAPSGGASPSAAPAGSSGG